MRIKRKRDLGIAVCLLSWTESLWTAVVGTVKCAGWNWCCRSLKLRSCWGYTQRTCSLSLRKRPFMSLVSSLSCAFSPLLSLYLSAGISDSTVACLWSVTGLSNLVSICCLLLLSALLRALHSSLTPTGWGRWPPSPSLILPEVSSC